MLKALSTNILVNHPSYPKILLAYNAELQEKGKVNALKFFRDVVKVEIPFYSQESWYYFLKRFKFANGLAEAQPSMKVAGVTGKDVQAMKEGAENAVAITMQSNAMATKSFIQAALNIGAARAKEILENPQLMSAKEAMDFAIKAMKAQDSRIHAIGKVREDNREEEKLERAFSNASYEQ